MDQSYNPQTIKNQIERFVNDEEHGPFLFTTLVSLTEQCNFLTDKMDGDIKEILESAFSLDVMQIDLAKLTISTFCSTLQQESLEICFFPHPLIPSFAYFLFISKLCD